MTTLISLSLAVHHWKNIIGSLSQSAYHWPTITLADYQAPDQNKNNRSVRQWKFAAESLPVSKLVQLSESKPTNKQLNIPNNLVNEIRWRKLTEYAFQKGEYGNVTGYPANIFISSSLNNSMDWTIVQWIAIQRHRQHSDGHIYCPTFAPFNKRDAGIFGVLDSIRFSCWVLVWFRTSSIHKRTQWVLNRIFSENLLLLAICWQVARTYLSVDREKLAIAWSQFIKKNPISRPRNWKLEQNENKVWRNL